MRTIDPIFSAAALASDGLAFARLVDFGDPSKVYPVNHFIMEGLTLKVQLNDFPITKGISFYTLERGLTIAGVEYSISSPYFYQSRISAPQGREMSVDFQIFRIGYEKFVSIDASLTALEVIDSAVLAFASTSTTTYNVGEKWLNFQFDRAGSKLNLNAFNGIIPMLWNKYLVKLFPRDDGVMHFQSRLITELQTADEYSWLTTASDKRTDIRVPDEVTSYNAFWTDENDVTHRLSAIYPALLVYPVRNIGFVHSSVALADIYEIHSGSLPVSSALLRHHSYTMPFTPSVENGDYLKIGGSQFLIASVRETYKMSGTKYPWQSEIKGTPMFYSNATE